MVEPTIPGNNLSFFVVQNVPVNFNKWSYLFTPLVDKLNVDRLFADKTLCIL